MGNSKYYMWLVRILALGHFFDQNKKTNGCNLRPWGQKTKHLNALIHLMHFELKKKTVNSFNKFENYSCTCTSTFYFFLQPYIYLVIILRILPFIFENGQPFYHHFPVTDTNITYIIKLIIPQAKKYLWGKHYYISFLSIK